MMIHLTIARWCRFGGLVALLTITGHFYGEDLSLDDVVSRNTAAMGGQEALAKMGAVGVHLHIVDPDFAVDGYYRVARPGKMRIDIEADGKHVYTEAFDGKRGWQWKGEGKTVVDESPKATAALEHGIELPGHLFGLDEVRKRGHQLTLHGREQLEGTHYYVLRLTLKDGYVTDLYVDPETWLITRRRDERPLHIDIDPKPTTIEQRMSDFRKVSGVTFSFANVEIDVKTGKVLETTTASEIAVNPPIDPFIFDQL
jgi:hypothetical protein